MESLGCFRGVKNAQHKVRVYVQFAVFEILYMASQLLEEIRKPSLSEGLKIHSPQRQQKKTESHIFVRENHLTLAEQGTSRRQHAHSDMPNVAPIIQKATVLPGIRVKTAGIQEIRHSILKPADR